MPIWPVGESYWYFGNAERTGGDAVAAADTGIGVVTDDAGDRVLVIAETGQAETQTVGTVHARGLSGKEKPLVLGILRFHRAVATS